MGGMAKGSYIFHAALPTLRPQLRTPFIFPCPQTSTFTVFRLPAHCGCYVTPPKPPIWMHGRGTYTGLRRARVITHTLTDPAQGQVAHVACPRVTVCPWSTWQHPKTDGRFLRGPDPRGKGAPPPEGSLIKHSRSNYPVLPPRSSKQDQF